MEEHRLTEEERRGRHIGVGGSQRGALRSTINIIPRSIETIDGIMVAKIKHL